MADLKISGLCKNYGNLEVLKDINLEIKQGEFVVFVGPSGCGKSTLLRCISGLEPITSGKIEIDGENTDNMPLDQRGVAMVFQSYALYPHMSVFENIAFSLRLQKIKKNVIKEKVEAVAEKLQLTPLLDRLPANLSGGQRQRVAIGRAIIRDPKIFLFDEPLSNLDASLRVQMRMEISQLKQQLPNTTMIYVTHDQVEAMTLADRIVVLNEGKIEHFGSPLSLYETPQSKFVAGFIGSPKMNFITGSRAKDFDAHTLGVRPESLLITKQNEGWAGKVVHEESLGSDTFVYVQIDSDMILVSRQSGKCHYAIDEELRVIPKEQEYHKFDENGARIH